VLLLNSTRFLVLNVFAYLPLKQTSCHESTVLRKYRINILNETFSRLTKRYASSKMHSGNLNYSNVCLFFIDSNLLPLKKIMTSLKSANVTLSGVYESIHDNNDNTKIILIFWNFYNPNCLDYCMSLSLATIPSLVAILSFLVQLGIIHFGVHCTQWEQENSEVGIWLLVLTLNSLINMRHSIAIMSTSCYIVFWFLL